MAHSNHDHQAGGEFQPSRPRDEPLTTSGHQVGQQVGNDAAPEFRAETLPAGSAPPANTFEPNPEGEVPGQADNQENMDRSHGKESTLSDPLDMPGATSGSVHRSIGDPNQRSTELGGGGIEGQGTTGGSGIKDGESAEAKRLATDKTDHGPITGHNVSLEGAEDKEPVRSEELLDE